MDRIKRRFREGGSDKVLSLVDDDDLLIVTMVLVNKSSNNERMKHDAYGQQYLFRLSFKMRPTNFPHLGNDHMTSKQ